MLISSIFPRLFLSYSSHWNSGLKFKLQNTCYKCKNLHFETITINVVPPGYAQRNNMYTHVYKDGSEKYETQVDLVKKGAWSLRTYLEDKIGSVPSMVMFWRSKSNWHNFKKHVLYYSTNGNK